MHGIKIGIIFLFSLCLSSTSFGKIDFFELSLRWASVYKFTINDNYLTSEAIDRPAGARVVLGELKLLATDFKSLKDCMIYQIPNKEIPGKLYIVSSLYKEECKDLTFKKGQFESDDIFNMSFSYNKNDLKLNIDEKVHKFEFFNIKNEQIKEPRVRHQFKVPGVEVSFVETFEIKTRLQNFEVCSDVARSCDQKPSTDICHLCPELGTYQVYASDCRKPIRRYCGIKKCGVKNSPACIRGRAASEYKGPFCIADSPVGFCHKPYRVLCINNELWCR